MPYRNRIPLRGFGAKLSGCIAPFQVHNSGQVRGRQRLARRVDGSVGGGGRGVSGRRAAVRSRVSSARRAVLRLTALRAPAATPPALLVATRDRKRDRTRDQTRYRTRLHAIIEPLPYVRFMIFISNCYN